MGSSIMKIILQLTLLAGVICLAWSESQCASSDNSCCQQDLMCKGVCHPVQPDSSQGWYSTSLCRGSSNCKCWMKKPCEIQHRNCSALKSSIGCIQDKPPQFADLQAAFQC